MTLLLIFFALSDQEHQVFIMIISSLETSNGSLKDMQ